MPGYDADLIAWDPKEEFIVEKEMILHRHPLTPYLQEQLSGKVKQTWLKGEKVFEDASPGNERGKFLHSNKGRILYHEQ